MNEEKDTIELMENGHSIYLPHLSIDCVIFGYHEQQLKVLLLKWKNRNRWSLPGGFIKNEENLRTAASRILKERTGLDDIFLQQFHTFGEPTRSERSPEDVEHLSSITNTPLDMEHWLLKRTVSICYYAVTEFSKVDPQPDFLSEQCEWQEIDRLPELIFDHRDMIEEALKTLRLHIYHQPIGYNLLSEKFTLPEIHDLYETILGKALDRRNFAKKLLSLGLIKKLNERKSIGAHRSPYLYKFDKRKYEKALKSGIVLVI
ncbi:NUDIX hydrolase [Limnovirga soli]|uniref:NUDIX domain-containing protein n=1 Tax=Limnovirga soli TaxID=2656915 RepID=A0A8J8FG50_9BACT|nr:NUDIX domain-containing protein [Limnovirga soli]NNV55231.1 NUDIX domain-containing protein [Limnovirga soli]